MSDSKDETPKPDNPNKKKPNTTEEIYKQKVIEIEEIEQAKAAEKSHSPEDSVIDESSEDDFLVYGSDRTKRQKTMLSFLMLGSENIHLPYTQIMLVRTVENRMISIYLHFGIIEIVGVNIDLIATRLKHGSLSYIREGGKQKPPTTPDGVCVYSITHKLTGITQE